MPGYQSHIVHRQHAGSRLLAESDELAAEVPVALEYNGISHAVVLATPGDLEDFARGFSLTEGIVRSMDDIYAIEITRQSNGVVLQLTIASACLHSLRLRRRNLTGRTGCGLCGVESLDDIHRHLPALPLRSGFLPAGSISRALNRLAGGQPLRQQTGATHGAAWATLDGHILFVREDVGRHNALDKIIGQLHSAGHRPEEGFVVISSRASFEIIQKAAAAGVSAVVAVSAPTSLAVSMATDLNIMLAGFARGEDFTVYTHPEYLLPDATTL